MASRFPDTPEQMRTIVGVGEVTFKKYGRQFLEVITSYLKEKGRDEGSIPIQSS
jgi:superfamily II DNA helicase RecQ